jgi:para-nitrobenzyl esterase
MIRFKDYSVGHYSSQFIVWSAAAFMLLAVCCFSLPTSVSAQTQDEASAPVLVEKQTTEGAVLGVENPVTNTVSWKAIPYAKPPVDDLRWKAPQPPEKRSEALNATKFCEICPQYISPDGNPATPKIVLGNEDCLYLNIWAPKNATATSKLPVFVWIHGGGNSIQWPLLSRLDGGILANKGNMIVVTFNYRLGPMGFLNHPALKGSDALSDSGNFAILDIIQALTWVKANVSAFGGDPGNVTITGESAGGQDVFALIASPLAKNLFQKAIAESAVIRPSTPAEGEAHMNGIITKLLVKDGKATDEKEAVTKINAMAAKEIEEYLRSKKAEDFLEMYPEGKSAGMIVFPQTFGDGKVLPVNFYDALKNGQYNKVPAILGTNKEEAKLFLRSYPTFIAWQKDLSLFMNPDKTELFELAAKYTSDGWKIMAVDHMARVMKNNPDQPAVFTYQFLWGAGGDEKSIFSPTLNVTLGACHSMEIDFVFGTEKAGLGAYVFNAKNRPGRVALSNAMMDYWTQFAKTGNPNRKDSSLPQWIAWSNAKGAPKTILLDADLNNYKITMTKDELTQKALEAALKKEKRQKEIQPYWDAAPYRMH